MRTEHPAAAGRLPSLLRLFSRLGITAFGGPAAHIAMMEDEVVERRRWISREHFLDLVGATSLIPGPNSTEMVLHIGYERAGFKGLLGAGLAFLGPAVSLTLLLAWIYQRYGTVPQLGGVFQGVQAAVLAVILGAVWKLGRKALSSPPPWLPALLAAAAMSAGLGPVTTLFGSTLIGGLWLLALRRGGGERAAGLLLGSLLSLPASASPAAGPGSATLGQLALFFLKIGAVLYGSGYVLVAFIEQGLVQDLGWLTQGQLLDAIAIGQLTPGPVLSSAAFVGYLVLGIPGGLIAAAAIFLPSFIFVAILNPIVPRLRRSPWARSFLDAVNAVAVAMMAVVLARLAWGLGREPALLVIALAAVVAVLRFKVASPWIVVGGGVAGAAASFAGL